jgi:hypothetical protein
MNMNNIYLSLIDEFATPVYCCRAAEENVNMPTLFDLVEYEMKEAI